MQPVARVPPAHPQFPSLVISHKPVVRLLLLRSADVTRYRLPDHRISPCPHSLSAAWSIPVFCFIPIAPNRFDPRQGAQANPLENSWNHPLLFHRASEGIGEIETERIRDWRKYGQQDREMS